MIRNEYRRAFIMLRAVMPGYGGHVRLERRTLTGSMYFIITAPQGVGELAAALVGQQNGVYYAAPIGPLNRDRRGQLALAWQFDPRSIDGRPLEAYPWIAVVATGGPCALALTGNVEGSRTVDARALERVACTLFAAGATDAAPAADLPEPEPAPAHFEAPVDDSPDVQTPTWSSPDDSESRATPVDGAGDGDEETRGDVRIYTMTRARLRRLAGRGDRAEAHQSAPAQPEQEAEVPQAAPEAGSAQAEPDAGMVGTAPESAALPTDPVTAAKRLGLDITVPWPGIAEALRRLFATQAPAADAPDDGFTYVAWPMPDGSGYGNGLVGLKVADGRITAIRHALPARRTPEPPAGLEDCQWLPGEGEAGFWVAEETPNQNLQ
ncbi:MAG: hypothetical protein IJ089_07440 [Clostridia bacterium]|nr:hypothetical protein [Clostridia bacterium]